MNTENKKNVNSEHKDKEKWYFSPADIILTTIFTLAFITQIILIFIYNNELNLQYLEYLGYGLWFISAVLGVLPIIIFKRKGKAPKGKSYMHTQKIVKKGLYAIVRHPQYLAGILLSIGITCITQSRISLILTVLITILTYQWTYSEDKSLIEKFGVEYEEYIHKVPRLNPILGIIYYFIKKD
jgi:protein-S-isoprenylcysteine O-methyltransferase Ste14